MTPLLIALLAGLAIWYVNDTLRCRERVVRAARNACAELRVQFLDQSVAQTRLGLGRGADGRLRLRREYRFDFSLDGSDRYAGYVTCIGQRVTGLSLDHPDGRLVQ
ncbi:hypothetical protein B1C78_15570 [Thioalkalivibrio denitrificans]|uniref:DUF3301 domain-containing protein n=1 Tax=Thioalkalivibrio denitrificans TaxID=108003 RepID=A0A1V3NAL4_9GAMM|nr:DUF3301 domain-containing protein [Thioalkalivibrio denitrificans]OOG22003.1 hypothetical protein B1C78_15570 [Thioalkalivibrio denitrificans]